MSSQGLRIKVLHKDAIRFEFIRRALADRERAMQISGAEFEPAELTTALNGSPPDVLIIDDASYGCLDAVEALGLRTPDVDTLLISRDTSAEFLMRAMRAGVREVIPNLANADALRAALTRVSHKRGRAAPALHEGKVMAFLSCKGGSGATFLAANLAYVLAAEFGKRVALIDLNLQFGDAAIFVSESRPPSHLAELAQQIHRLDASMLVASMLEAAPNLFVLAAPEDPAMAGDVKREHIDAIVRIARQNFDFVIFDVSRSLDAVSLQALDLADTVLPVLQLTLPYVRDGKRLLTIFRSLGYPRSKVQLVVNRYVKGGDLTLDDLERAVDEKVAHIVPNSYAAAASSVNLGIPILRAHRSNPISKVLVDIGRDLVPADAQPDSAGWLARMFSRSGT